MLFWNKINIWQNYVIDEYSSGLDSGNPEKQIPKSETQK